MDGYIADGVEIGPAPTYLNSQNNPYTTPQAYAATPAGSLHAYPLPIDQSPRFSEYTIGSDVPADVDCAQTPEHADCQA